MKKILYSAACCFLMTTAAFSQERQQVDTTNQTSAQKGKKPDTANNDTFRDDSTDASMGMSGLSGTPGTATTTGAGGLGTNETRPYENTSSDIYNMERIDSIKNAEQRRDSLKSKNKNKAGSK